MYNKILRMVFINVMYFFSLQVSDHIESVMSERSKVVSSFTNYSEIHIIMNIAEIFYEKEAELILNIY